MSFLFIRPTKRGYRSIAHALTLDAVGPTHELENVVSVSSFMYEVYVVDLHARLLLFDYWQIFLK